MKLSKVRRQKEYRNSHAQRWGRGEKKSENKTKTNHRPCPLFPSSLSQNPWQKHQERNSGENSVMKVEEERDTCLKLLGSQSWKEPQLRQGPGSDQCKILLRECFQNKKRKRRIQYKNARIMKNIGEEQNLPI